MVWRIAADLWQQSRRTDDDGGSGNRQLVKNTAVRGPRAGRIDNRQIETTDLRLLAELLEFRAKTVFFALALATTR